MGFQPRPTQQPGWIEEVRERLARRALPEALDETDLKRAAVLLPLFVRNGTLWILLTRRTETVEHHRGQISFPGGAEEADDRSLLETALRESEEEIGLKRQDAIPLGSLSPMRTVTSFYVEPFVAAIPQPYVFRPQESEIAEIIEAPLPALADPAILETKPYPGRPEPVLFYHYGRHTIWGATARMLADLLDALR
jgi:8-oxo-dGTP pyrophosphatase MutT (NUDIX family)